jgi:hypothetical protein
LVALDTWNAVFHHRSPSATASMGGFPHVCTVPWRPMKLWLDDIRLAHNGYVTPAP